MQRKTKREGDRGTALSLDDIFLLTCQPHTHTHLRKSLSWVGVQLFFKEDIDTHFGNFSKDSVIRCFAYSFDQKRSRGGRLLVLVAIAVVAINVGVLFVVVVGSSPKGKPLQ